MILPCLERVSRSMSVGLACLLLAGLVVDPSSLCAQSPGQNRHTMVFRGVHLHEALERVVETTHIDLLYDSELVQDKTVFCSAREALPEELLRCLLADVPVDYYQTSGGTYVLTPPTERPPRHGDLGGIVVDDRTGEPLPHAHVLLATANTGAATNEAGQFQLPHLISGKHRVVATHLGYEATVDSVYVPPGDTVRRRIALTPTPIASEPVIVDGIERYTPEGRVGAKTLPGRELAEPGRMGTPDALGHSGTLVGVRQQPPRADLHVQGGAAGEHEVRLDGIPVRNPVTLRRFLGAFSPLALDRLTVHKAGFGVEHGSTISGIVAAEHALNASTPSFGQLTVDPLSVNAEGHGSVELGAGNAAHFRIAARSSLWDLYQDPTLNRLLRDWNVVDPMLLSSYFDGDDPTTIRPAAQTVGTGFSDLHAATRIDLGPYRSLSVSGYRGRNHLRTQFVARDPVGMLTRDQYDWANTAGQARLDWTLGARSSASIQLRASEHRVHRGYQMTYGSPDPGAPLETVVDTLQRTLDPSLWPDDRNQIEEWALEATGSYAATTQHHLRGALEASRLMSRFRLGGRFLRSLSFRDTQWHVSGYLRDVMSLGMGTTLTAGTRFTYIPARQTVYAEPRLELHHEGSLRATSPYAVRLAGGVYRQYVNRFDASSTSPTAILPSMRFWMPVGPSHAPPRAYHATVDGRVEPHEHWTLSGEAYYKHYGRLLALDYPTLNVRTTPPVGVSSVSPASAITATRGHAAGLGGSLTRSGARLRSTLRYNWSRSHRQFPGRFQGRSVPVPWNQPQHLSLSVEGTVANAFRVHLQAERRWGQTWGFRQIYYDYVGLRSTSNGPSDVSLQNPGAHALAPHTRVDLGAQYSVHWNGLTLKSQLTLVNVFDRQNPFDWGLRSTDSGTARTTRHLPGRRLVGSLTIRY